VFFSAGSFFRLSAPTFFFLMNSAKEEPDFNLKQYHVKEIWPLRSSVFFFLYFSVCMYIYIYIYIYMYIYTYICQVLKINTWSIYIRKDWKHQEAEAGRLWVQGQPGLNSEILSQKSKLTKKQELKAVIWRDIWIPSFKAALCTVAERQKQLKYPTIDKCVSKIRYIHATGYYPVLKKN
jgi:hypothetical protein